MKDRNHFSVYQSLFLLTLLLGVFLFVPGNLTVYADTNDEISSSDTTLLTSTSLTTEEMYEAIDEVVAELVESWSHYTSQYDRIYAIVKWMANNITYDSSITSYANTQTKMVYYALVEHKAFCAGYSHTFVRLADAVGIEAIYVTGQVKSGTRYLYHAWNLVKLGDYYYYVDPTWAATGGTKYFLFVSLSDHIVDSAYSTEEWLEAHPLAESKYSTSHTCTYREEVLTEATCTTGGTYTEICRLCGETTGQELSSDPLGHDLSYTEGVEATCLKAGMEEYYTCASCGGYFADSEGTEEIEDLSSLITPAKGHTYGDWEIVTKATCETEGLKVCTCSDCGDKQSAVISATGHSYGAWVVEKEATCEEDGLKTSTCSGCGDQQSEVITASGHAYSTAVTTKEATCEEEGTKTSTCSACGKELVENIAAKGHTYGAWVVTKEATCEDEGEQTKTCSACGKIITESIAATGHSYGSWVVTKEATCTTAGTKTKTCTSCGNTVTETIAATGHSYGSWVVTKEATCTTAGTKTKTCTSCGNTVTETIAATGHSYGSWVITKVATMSYTGSKTKTCSVCGATQTETIAKLEQKTGVEGFVTRLYNYILERNPDTTGLNNWVNALKAGTQTGAEVAYGFVFSDEYTNRKTTNTEFVTMLYNTILGRTPDSAGLEDWVSQLDNGCTRYGIFAGFIGSSEFTSLCKTYGITRGSYTSPYVVDKNPQVTAFVARLYTKALGRSFDSDGLSDWVSQLLNKTIGGGEVSKGFFLSKEFINKKYSDTTFVTICYRVYLNREPDAAGLADWVNQLAKGATRESILDGFIGSPEYGKLCTSYGINR